MNDWLKLFVWSGIFVLTVAIWALAFIGSRSLMTGGCAL